MRIFRRGSQLGNSGEKNSPPTRRIATFLAFFLIIVIATLSIRNWIAYERVRSLRNPVAATETAIAAAQRLYGDHCQKCHGVTGNGKGPKAAELSVSPGDFTDAQKMGRETDGEIFWRISRGRYPMPPFEDQISAEGRWMLVDYIRTFQQPSAANSGHH